MLRIRGLSARQIVLLSVATRPPADKPLHVFFCVADHHEPKWNRPLRQVELDRVGRWVRDYPRLADGLQDSRGRCPQHTFFYPQDEYDAALVEPIARLCERGYGDMEVHLHHDRDTADGLREKLDRFTQALHREHGMLHRDGQGRLSYAFIHGNWALNNSRTDGRWCGVNDETSILLETGCYADMTMPSAPADCQTATINKIYYAAPDPKQPKAHDRGPLARRGTPRPKDSLLMIQGPLALDWGRRKWGLLPRLENGDLTAKLPPTLSRLKLWLNVAPRVAGRDDWVFVKLHTHGAQEANAAMLLGEPMRHFHQSLGEFAQQNGWFRHYYVTAREMASLVAQAERGIAAPEF